MVDHMTLLRDIYGPFEGLNPGMAGLEDCESLFTYVKTERMIAEKYLARHFSRIQHPFVGGGLGNA